MWAENFQQSLPGRRPHIHIHGGSGDDGSCGGVGTWGSRDRLDRRIVLHPSSEPDSVDSAKSGMVPREMPYEAHCASGVDFGQRRSCTQLKTGRSCGRVEWTPRKALTRRSCPSERRTGEQYALDAASPPIPTTS